MQLEGGVADSERAATPGPTAGPAEPRASAGSGRRKLLMTQIIVTRKVNQPRCDRGRAAGRAELAARDCRGVVSASFAP